MKGRWKWVLLAIGVLLISATCGFGFQAKIARSDFEIAADALEHRDWERFVAVLPEPTSPNRPPKSAILKFMKTYADPILRDSEYVFHRRSVASKYVPIPDDVATYDRVDNARGSTFATLRFGDQLAYFTLPFSKTNYYVYQGKSTHFAFLQVFRQVAGIRGIEWVTEDHKIPFAQFVRHEEKALDAMGIKPNHLYSSEKTWASFADAVEKRNREWASRSPAGTVPRTNRSGN